MGFNRSEIKRYFTDFRQYWESIRIDGAVPSRADFRPEKIRDLLPYVDIEEYVSDTELVSRLRGTELVKRNGIDLTGQNILPYFNSEFQPYVMGHIQTVLQTPCGIEWNWTTENSNGKLERNFGLYLPLNGGENARQCIIGLALNTTEKDWALEESGPTIGLSPKMKFIDLGFGLPRR